MMSNVHELVAAIGLALTFAIVTPASMRQGESGSGRFRSEADMVIIDAQVVPKQGASLPVLTSDRFEVRIAGRKRAVVSAVFLHYDDGVIVRRPQAEDRDPATVATCVFGNVRTVDRVHAHYRLAIETLDADRIKVPRVSVKVTDKAVRLQSWAWRSKR
jgi:hypothetical protein